MVTLRTDLPLRDSSTNRFVPVVVAIMVFLAALAACGLAVFDSLLANWTGSVTGTMTVQVSPSPESGPDNENLSDILSSLQQMDGITSARLIERAEINTLLEPWLGSSEEISTLPLPALIDISLTEGSEITASDVRDALQSIAPDATVDDHRVWFNRLIELVEGLELIGAVIMALVAGALILTVVFATRASLAEFKEVIGILHLAGAQDRYIAIQFGKRALIAGLKGACAGFLMALPVIGGLSWLGSRIETNALPDVTLGLVFWVTLPMVALTAAIIVMATAFATVLGTLRTMI